MKKIMFNDRYGLTTAVIAGRKTQTRRLVSEELLREYGHNSHSDKSFDLINAAPYRVGDVVAIAVPYKDFLLPTKSLRQLPAWNNKMFVRADKMPFRIEITKVRVERLQDISDEDCLAEGVIKYANGVYTYVESGKKFFHPELDTPKKAFAALIDKINGKNTWERNPWVYAYTFKLVK